MTHAHRTPVFILLLTAGMVLLGSGCGRPPAARGGPPADMKVLSVVAPVTVQPIGDVLDLVGDLEARDAVDLVSEVDARLDELGFEEGREVARGQLLFRFDDERLQAQLAQARAAHALAMANRKRAAELLRSHTIPQQDFDQADAAALGAEAGLALATRNAADAKL